MSGQGSVRSGKCPVEDMSGRGNVWSECVSRGCDVGELSVEEMSNTIPPSSYPLTNSFILVINFSENSTHYLHFVLLLVIVVIVGYPLDDHHGIDDNEMVGCSNFGHSSMPSMLLVSLLVCAYYYDLDEEHLPMS